MSTNLKDSEIYRNVKNLIIDSIKNKYLKMNNPSNNVRKTISDSLTLIILSGIFCHWTTCINDLINECTTQGNLEYIFIVLRALGSIDLLIHYNNETTKEESYEDSIKISQKEKMQIKDKLIENKNIVIKFLLTIYNNINNFTNENLRKIMISQLFDTTKCWTNFELNLLKNENISKMIYSIMNINVLENPENFSNMICDTINNSNCSKIYKSMVVDKNSSPQKLSEELFKLIDLEEKKGIDLLLNFILPKLDELKENKILNTYQKKLFKEYAKILASVIENYIYLFFNFNDKRSEIILGWLRYFLKNKKRQISLLFFEGLDEMREFINNFYRFSGLNNQQKIDFVNYLMDIVYGVMENCSYTKLDQKDISLLEQEILCKSSNLRPDMPISLHTLNEYKNNYLEEYDDDMEDIDVNQYRLNAESVFYNIFFILIENFHDPGTSQFLNKILSSLQLSQINDDKYLNDRYSDIKIDVVFFVISSILEIFEIEDAPNSINIIHNLINVFLGAKIVFQNQRIFIDFIILINKFSQKLVLQQENFKKIVEFLLLVSKSSNNENIIQSCYIVLLNICNEINNEMKLDNSFIKEIFNLYQNIYNKYQYPNITPLENVIDIILTFAGISQKIIRNNKINPEQNINYNPNLIYVIQQISSPINNEIKTLIEKVENNIQDTKLKNFLRFEIVKGYLLQGRIFSSLKKFSIELRNNFLQEHLNITLNTTKKIFELFQNDEDIITPLIKFYIDIASAIGGNCHSHFNLFNNIMINYFLSSENHFKVLEILKLFYLSFIISIDKTDKMYMQNNKYILDQYSLIMNSFINNISKLNNINSSINEKIKAISDFHHYIFKLLCFNSELLIQNNEIMKYYNLVQIVINFFLNCITLFQNIEVKESVDELTLISIIRSFNSFIINISLSKEFLTQTNNNNSCIFINMILSIWNIIFYKQFNCSARKELKIYFFNAIQYDINLFSIAFEKCISKSNKFTPVYIKSIIEYIQCFENDKDGINKMLDLVIDNVQGSAELDRSSFSFLLSLVPRKKGLKKINK